MPRKPQARPAELPAIPAELLEQIGKGPMTAEAINAARPARKKALIERALGGETSHHLGYPPDAVTNQRNSTGAKTVLAEDGPIRIEVPRDRDGSFEPLLIPKHERDASRASTTKSSPCILGQDCTIGDRRALANESAQRATSDAMDEFQPLPFAPGIRRGVQLRDHARPLPRSPPQTYC